jgi:threonine/homoserine/homoserine lactone efflux protein
MTEEKETQVKQVWQSTSLRVSFATTLCNPKTWFQILKREEKFVM